ncbi:MAG: class I SAM-dependent methyltransferase [Candidatus Eisenbacteria bacterium]
MFRETSPSGILESILSRVRPGPSDAAHLRFERMESQADLRIPEIHIPIDVRDPEHWARRGLIWDYVQSLDGASKVLDVGPGDGWPALLLAPHFHEVVGIEPGPRRVESCRANARRMRLRKVRFEQMSACRMDFEDGIFDGAVAATSIEQTPDPAAALREIHRVLKPGGVLRMSFEVLEEQPEPVREVVSIRGGDEGVYWIDYTIVWRDQARERGIVVEVQPASDVQASRLAMSARRCKEDRHPCRDPRLERGLAATVRGIESSEIRSARTFHLSHFRTDRLLATLRRIGFDDVRSIVGGAWPARRIAQELVAGRRIPAAAPLLEELCRSAAAMGIAMETARSGQILARKPHGSGRPAVRKRVAPISPAVRKRVAPTSPAVHKRAVPASRAAAGRTGKRGTVSGRTRSQG